MPKLKKTRQFLSETKDSEGTTKMTLPLCVHVAKIMLRKRKLHITNICRTSIKDN